MPAPPKKFNRRDFLRLAGLSLLGLGLEPLLSACRGPEELSATPTTRPVNTLIPTNTSTPQPTDPAPTATPAAPIALSAGRSSGRIPPTPTTGIEVASISGVLPSCRDTTGVAAETERRSR